MTTDASHVHAPANGGSCCKPAKSGFPAGLVVGLLIGFIGGALGMPFIEARLGGGRVTNTGMPRPSESAPKTAAEREGLPQAAPADAKPAEPEAKPTEGDKPMEKPTETPKPTTSGGAAS